MKLGFGHGRKTFRSTADSMNVGRVDLLCRTAVYVIRMYGGVGGRSREASPYPDLVPEIGTNSAET